MAFWMRKNTPTKSDSGRDNDSQSGRKRKDEKARPQVKRFDNLRIPHQLPVVLKSLGTQNEFSFVTKDLSATGLFVLCANFKDYPFQQTSTILDCELNLGALSHPPNAVIRMLGKIARIVEPTATERQNPQAGFGLRIVQISHEHRVILENYIATNGTPDLNNLAVSDMRFQARKTEGAEGEATPATLAPAS